MIITKEQAQLIADLAGQIREKYGFIIGYSNPQILLPSQEDADFIIFDNPNFDDLHCFYKKDIEMHPIGPYMIHVLPAEPEFDDQVKNLITRLNNDLLEGKIWFDPCATRVEDNITVEVTKKRLPGTKEDYFSTNIKTEGLGTVYTYEHIAEAANYDKRFKIAKELIDENWPRERKTEPEIQPEIKPEIQPETPSTISVFLAKVLRLFGF